MVKSPVVFGRIAIMPRASGLTAILGTEEMLHHLGEDRAANIHAPFVRVAQCPTDQPQRLNRAKKVEVEKSKNSTELSISLSLQTIRSRSTGHSCR